MSTTTTRGVGAVVRHRLFWPAAVLAVLLLANLAFTPDFFAVHLKDGHLYGSLIDILHFGAPLILVSLGMTLVIATGGIDLSVGSTVAIAGALACLHISESSDPGSLGTVLAAVGIALGTALVLGLANGVLVAKVGVQPIIATLILMVAGRGVAQLVTDGQIITVTSEPYKLIGGGYWLAMPFAILLSGLVAVLTALLTRSTALGLLLESVGGNPVASRLVGIRAMRLIGLVYVFSALCAALAGLMVSSNVSAADGNNAGLWIELDAILAVVVGGTSLTGGRFSIGGTVLGALIIQTLSTTVYTVGIPPETTLVFKAFVVITVCLIQSPNFRAKLARRRGGAGRGAAPRQRSTAGATTATTNREVGA
ncbi:ABC transporter permease [Kitasatospora terrestris]|uniref:ABC transporter permease n=1 Tax=Kitasatospora terrestris TaxID=258051 RepID=UPI0031EFAD5B